MDTRVESLTSGRKVRLVKGTECPACGHRFAFHHKTMPSIRVCARCEAFFGQCYLGESYEIARPVFARAEVSPDDQRYFDFTCLSSKGIVRRHGWFALTSRRITQVG